MHGQEAHNPACLTCHVASCSLHPTVCLCLPMAVTEQEAAQCPVGWIMCLLLCLYLHMLLVLPLLGEMRQVACWGWHHASPLHTQPLLSNLILQLCCTHGTSLPTTTTPSVTAPMNRKGGQPPSPKGRQEFPPWFAPPKPSPGDARCTPYLHTSGAYIQATLSHHLLRLMVAA